MRYLDLFTGYGGFSLGIKQAFPDAECVGFSEINPYAVQTYNKHFQHKNYGDITKIKAEELPDLDLIAGGFPCQAFSLAGKRRGFEDTRGTLIFDVLRIIRAKHPRWVLLENVKGLLSHDNGRTFKTIITALAELGYIVEWQVLNAKSFGVPQRRERVFIVGHFGKISGRPIFPITGNDEKNGLGIKRIAHMRGYRRYNLTYDDAGIIETLDTAQGGGHQPCVIVREATKRGYAVAGGGDSINLSVPSSKTRRGRVGKNIAQTLDTGMQQYTLQGNRIRRIMPTECERLMGLPDEWTNGHSDSQRYKLCGNGVVVPVVREIVKRLINNSI
jgi:DNA (cytosine-5)-methyltransferase 1